jgi:hypothetical protein
MVRRAARKLKHTLGMFDPVSGNQRQKTVTFSRNISKTKGNVVEARLAVHREIGANATRTIT